MEVGDRVLIVADSWGEEEVNMHLAHLIGKRATVLDVDVHQHMPMILGRLAGEPRLDVLVTLRVDGEARDHRFNANDLRPLSLPERIGEIE